MIGLNGQKREVDYHRNLVLQEARLVPVEQKHKTILFGCFEV